MALRFNKAFKSPKDDYAILRSLVQLPGEVHAAGPEDLEAHLQRPDSEKVARAFQAFFDEINQEQPRLLGDGPILRFNLLELT